MACASARTKPTQTLLRRGAGPDKLAAVPTGPLTHTAALLISFACLATIHLVLAVSLIRDRAPSWHGFLVLLPPLAWLAPYWGFREGKIWLSVLWLLSGAAYVITLIGALQV